MAGTALPRVGVDCGRVHEELAGTGVLEVQKHSADERRREAVLRSSRESRTASKGRNRACGEKLRISKALAVTALALLATGYRKVGSLCALSALAIEGGIRSQQPAEKNKEESKTEGKGTMSTQDDKPFRRGGVTQDGKPGGGSGATSSVQDGKAASRGISKQDGEAASRDLGSMARAVIPGLRTLRTRNGSDSHGEQMPIPPTPDGRGRGGHPQNSSREGRMAAAGRAAMGDARVSSNAGPHPTELPETMNSIGERFESLDMTGFMDEPRGEDRWDLKFWDRGYVIRKHGKGGKMPFQPLHRTALCRGEQLYEERMTVCIYPDKSVYVREDSWQDTQPWKSTEE